MSTTKRCYPLLLKMLLLYSAIPAPLRLHAQALSAKSLSAAQRQAAVATQTDATTKGGMMQTRPANLQEMAVRNLITQLEQAWNSGDAASWSKAFSEDAKFTTLRGDVLQGRQAIEASHRMIFSGFYKESHNAISLENLDFPASNVGVVDLIHEVTRYAMLPPGIPPTEPGVLRSRMKLVAVQHGQTWSFTSAQNTSVYPKPAANPTKPAAQVSAK